MKTVTFKVKSPPSGADHWHVAYGAQTPFSTYQLDWGAIGSAAITDSLTGQVADDARYIRVRAFIAGVPGDLYQGETTSPTVFAEGGIYTFDCATNSLVGEAPPPPAGNWVTSLIDIVVGIGDWFYQAYLTTRDWVWPFSLLAEPLYQVYFAFRTFINPLYTFQLWVNSVTAAIASIGSSIDIIGLLRDWLTMAENAWEWVSDWWENVKAAISSWWATILPVVQGWISSATEGLLELRVKWDTFWTTIYPNLVDWTWLGDWWAARLVDMDALLNTAFTLRESWWSGWQESRTNVLAFLNDPLEWLWERFTDWFLGGEEK